MGRHKTISDSDLLEVARRVFRSHGHSASTRQIAEQAGISEAILYQRFGSKDELFFAAMAATEPDIDAILGPMPPPEDTKAHLCDVILRLTEYFGEVLPLALRIVTHPSFDRNNLVRAHAAVEKLQAALALRLKWIADHHRMRPSAVEPTAQLVVGIAHDLALAHAMKAPSGSAASRAPKRPKQLEAIVNVIWEGARAPSPTAKPARRR